MPKPHRCTYVRGLGEMNYSLQSGYIVGIYIISDCMQRQSQDENKHIVTKDVVSLLIGEVVSTKKHTSSQRMWLACF